MSVKEGFCPECWIGISGHEQILRMCRNCGATWDDEDANETREETIDRVVDENWDKTDSEEETKS